MHWWSLPEEEVANALGTSLQLGLSFAEAENRLRELGPNILIEGTRVGALSILLNQFKNLVIGILLAATLVSGLLWEWLDAFAIFGIVVLNALLGFIQEFRAEKSLLALKKLSTPSARVIREGTRQQIPAERLVPGDLIELEAGDRVPADARLFSVIRFQTQEAPLTGESAPVSKETGVLPKDILTVADRLNMVFLGTTVATGKARGLVTETGMATEVGHIARLLETIKHETTPLQQRLERLGRWLIYLCGVIVTIIFLLGKHRGVPTLEMFLTSVSLAVAAIPEGLPAVVTIALALGVQRMAWRKALIRKLPAVETLGCTQVICSDKTGTLTQNEMMVQELWSGGRIYKAEGLGYNPSGRLLRPDGSIPALDSAPELLLTLRIGVLCNDAELVKKEALWSVRGDPTEGALLAAAGKASIDKDALEAKEPVYGELPFDSNRKRMTVVRKYGNGWRAYVKGAPDTILARSRAWENGKRQEDLTPPLRQDILTANEEFGRRGWRVLAMAYRDFDQPPPLDKPEFMERELVFAGMQAMEDPPRPEAVKAIARCREAGIRSVMITGDHAKTAAAIAQEMGLLEPGRKILTGEELDRLTDDALAREAPQVAVYARVSAEHKLRVVRAWQANGAVVAMTGDGVNDAPALKEADIGVAMGVTGTDVAKEAADMLILDDNFATLAAAVEEGRGIYDNIRKFVYYLLSCNTGEVLVMLLASLAGWPNPLVPIQILWINLLTDGLPALALGLEPPEPDFMKQPPRRPEDALVSRRLIADLALTGLLIGLATLAAFAWIYFREPDGLVHARSMAFFVLTTTQLAHALNARSDRQSIWQVGLFGNRWLWGALGLSLGLQLVVTFSPGLQGVFKTCRLTGADLAIAAGASTFLVAMVELIKRLRQRATLRRTHEKW